jgi:hypothetical protein
MDVMTSQATKKRAASDGEGHRGLNVLRCGGPQALAALSPDLDFDLPPFSLSE